MSTSRRFTRHRSTESEFDRISAALFGCEPLETRVLLSTINWTNRVVSDNFGIYGANTAVARTIWTARSPTGNA